MNLIFLIGLGCFCFNQVILTPTDEIKSENIPEEIFKSNELCNRMDGKTQFMDLNVDCQLLALEKLDFIFLLSLAEINDDFKSLISIIFERMFRKNVVDLRMRPEIWLEDVIISDDFDYIRIKNVTIAEQLLKNFGHLIQKLQIKCTDVVRDSSCRSIYKLVNLHCSKTLKEITLEKSVDNYLDEFTNQFENVEEVFIDSNLETERRLNEIFSSVRRLHFNTYRISNTDSINVKYTNLEHLHIIGTYVGSLTNNLAAELIRKNSHIRSLALERASAKLMKTAADSLPQLERLKLHHIQSKYNNESIALPKVKILEIKGCADCLFLNLKFGNVEELHIDYLAENMFEETGFLASNKNLKKLQLVLKYYNIYLNNAFNQLIHTNTTLRDIFISNASGVEVEPILQLIENNKQLERLEINFFLSRDLKSISTDLRKRISDVWFMDDSPWEEFPRTIILKKKHILY